MTDPKLDLLYNETLQRVLNDTGRLPSLPDITMKVREAIDHDNTTCDSLTNLISKDPSLTAYLVKAASSPVYRRAIPPKTLAEVVGVLGFSAVNSLVMLHSVHELIELKDETAKNLFKQTWERLVVKTSVASFLAQTLKYRPVEQVQMATLLTEIGSLMVLSTMLETDHTPDPDTYFKMCREYSKQIGVEVLSKWEVDKTIVDVLTDCGNWNKTWDGSPSLLDIVNLSLYHTVLLTLDKPSLPDLESLSAYKKLPQDLQQCSNDNWLSAITNNQEEIQNTIRSFT